MSEEETKVILEKLDELKGLVTAKKKDFWDVLALVSQFTSTVILGVATVLINNKVQHANEQASSAQIRLQEASWNTSQGQLTVNQTELLIKKQEQFAEYLRGLADADDTGSKKATLIVHAPIAVPDQAKRLAQFYLSGPYPENLHIAAIRALGELHENALLKDAALRSLTPAESDEIKKQLGIVLKNIRVRVSDIDDFGKVIVNGVEILSVSGTEDSGWRDITSNFQPGKNTLIFRLINGPYGGYSGRFRLMAAGGREYDSGKIARDACPCNGPVFDISSEIDLESDGKIKSVSDAVFKYY
ncbi:MAG: hypothetical protein ACRD59_16200 [Candidatus Acidiferrales bacterium]